MLYSNINNRNESFPLIDVYFNKYFIAEDCGGGIKGKKIDIFMDSEAKCRQWGVRKIKIKIVKGGKSYAQ